MEIVFPSQDMEVTFPDLSPRKMEARRSAVTLRELDQPLNLPLDDWSSSLDGDSLPRVTVDQLMDPPGLVAVDEDLGSVLHGPDQDDDSVLMPSLPLKATRASEPELVTPALQEERRKRSPLQPAVDVVIVPPPVDDGCDDEAVNQKRKRSSLVMADTSMEEAEEAATIPPPPNGEMPDSFVLPEVTNTNTKPKKKKRKVQHVARDQETAIPSVQMKAQMEDYKDTMMEGVQSALSVKTVDQLFQQPGRGVESSGLPELWAEDLALLRGSNNCMFDWPEQDVGEVLDDQLAVQDVPEDVSDISGLRSSDLSVAQDRGVSSVINLQLPVPDEEESQPEPAAAFEAMEIRENPAPVDREEDHVPSILLTSPPQRDPQDIEPVPLPISPMPGTSHLHVSLPDFMDLPVRPDDTLDSSPVLDQIDSMLEEGQGSLVLSRVLESEGPARKDVAKMFEQILMLEKKEELRLDQDEEDVFGATTVTRL